MGVALADVDLRWGIDVDAKGAQVVASCLAEVGSARFCSGLWFWTFDSYLWSNYTKHLSSLGLFLDYCQYSYFLCFDSFSWTIARISTLSVLVLFFGTPHIPASTTAISTVG